MNQVEWLRFTTGFKPSDMAEGLGVFRHIGGIGERKKTYARDRESSSGSRGR